jgi:nucleoside-diphosphate-sugar epimerase
LSVQPIKEEALLSGKLELTSEPYAVAKIAGLKMCESYNRQYGDTQGIDYRSVIPATLYGPGDNYNLERIFKDCNVDHIDFMKVDVDGYEYPFILNAIINFLYSQSISKNLIIL